jgi:hypothetical protein
MTEEYIFSGSRSGIAMIEMKCPACGVAGRVSKDKLNTRLVCRKCLKVFHVTPTGRAVLGEPPQAAVTANKAPREKVEIDFGLNLPPWLGRFAKFVFSPRVLAVVGGLILLAGGYIGVSILRGESLQERTVKVARAAVMDDLATLLELSSTDTGDATLLWYTALRPQCEEFKGSLQTPTPFVEVLVNKEDTNNGTVSVVARINSQEPLSGIGARLPGASVGSLTPNKSLELPLEFISEGLGGWRLDGKRTFAAIPKNPEHDRGRSH